MLHVVLRNMTAYGKDLKPGDIVETSGWKNERLLREQGRIRPADEQVALTMEAEKSPGAKALAKAAKRVPVVGKVPSVKKEE